MRAEFPLLDLVGLVSFHVRGNYNLSHVYSCLATALPEHVEDFHRRDCFVVRRICAADPRPPRRRVLFGRNLGHSRRPARFSPWVLIKVSSTSVIFRVRDFPGRRRDRFTSRVFSALIIAFIARANRGFGYRVIVSVTLYDLYQQRELLFQVCCGDGYARSGVISAGPCSSCRER